LLHSDSSKRCVQVCPLYKFLYAFKVVNLFLKHPVFSKISCRLEDNVEKYGGVRHTTGSNIVRYMRLVRCISKAADTRPEYVIFSLQGTTAPSGAWSLLYRGFTTTLGRNPLDECSVQRTDLYLTTHNTYKRDIHARIELAIPASERTLSLARICNNYCFSTTAINTRLHLDITLYVHCLSCNHI
jgi:hypothetical protein